MANTAGAPAQYSKPSRKGKKAWRKNIDVTEIQDGLEQIREQAVRGRKILFVEDFKGSEAIQKAVLKAHKPLKVDEILAQRSAIPAVSTHKRASGTTDGVVESSRKKHKSEYVSPAERERLRRRAYGGLSYEVEITHTAPSADPWASVVEEPKPKNDYLPEVKPVRAPKTIAEAPISLLASGKVLPAVLKPKQHQSYNPNFEDWDATLTLEGQKEVLAEQARLKAASEEAELQARREAAAKEIDKDPLLDDASEWEGFESEYESDAEWLSRKRPERKTPQQRRKAEKRKENERLEKHLAKAKERDQQLRNFKDIAKMVKVAALIDDPLMDKSDVATEEEDIDDNALRKKRYGKLRVPKKDLELVLPDELQDSLRALRPEGNLLGERFRNMMVSGRIEARPTKRQPGKRAKRTVTEKWAYKDFTI